MPRYKFNGDSPRSLPQYGIEVVSPGETVETDRELEHPDFKLLPDKKKSKSEDAEPTAAAPADQPPPAEPVLEPVPGKE